MHFSMICLINLQMIKALMIFFQLQAILIILITDNTILPIHLIHGLPIGQIQQLFDNNGIFLIIPHGLAAMDQFMWHFNTIFQLVMHRICQLF